MELSEFYRLMGTIDLVEPPKHVLEELLMHRLERVRPSGSERRRVRRAFDISFEGHKNAPLRASGEAYIFHIVRGAFDIIEIMYEFGLRDFEWLVNFILHDVVEDAPEAGRNRFLTQTNIVLRMGYETSQEVSFLSKRTVFGKKRNNYFPELLDCGYWRPQGAKFIDRTDNMRTLFAMPRNSQLAKIKETETFALPLRDAMFRNLCVIADQGQVPFFKLHLPSILYRRLMAVVATEKNRLEHESQSL